MGRRKISVDIIQGFLEGQWGQTPTDRENSNQQRGGGKHNRNEPCTLHLEGPGHLLDCGSWSVEGLGDEPDDLHLMLKSVESS